MNCPKCKKCQTFWYLEIEEAIASPDEWSCAVAHVMTPYVVRACSLAHAKKALEGDYEESWREGPVNWRGPYSSFEQALEEG